ncbi:MAG: hypothetical protein QW719_02865 [Candidatus Micrarchaeaceae archaeon]
MNNEDIIGLMLVASTLGFITITIAIALILAPAIVVNPGPPSIIWIKIVVIYWIIVALIISSVYKVINRAPKPKRR